MFDSYFLPYQQLLIVIAFLFYFSSIFLFEFSKKQTLSILFLILGTLVFKIFVITADEFINLWDEQYHALVAKNLSKNLFFPKLYPETILPYNYESWTNNYVWVHKQPFFLMQMALCIKIFGATSFAIRLPSALCFTFATFCVYKIGENTLTKRIGFIGALLFSMNYFFNELMVGYLPTDHNDIIFMCYIIASIWAYTEYLKNKTFKWTLFVALFSSFAVLTKWLPGYIVFGVWFVYLIQEHKTFKLHKKEWIVLLKTFALATILPLTYQIYIYIYFPLETAHEQSFNAKHITEALEGHGGDSFFYLQSISKTIGYLAPYFVLLGIILLNKYVKERKMFTCFLFAVAVVYIFFTNVLTKMDAFPFFVFFIFFLGFGAIGQQLFDYLNLDSNVFKKIIFACFLIYCSIVVCNLEAFQKIHTQWRKDDYGLQNFRNHNVNWYKTCQEINKELKDEKYVVFNCDPIDFIKLMFYTDKIGYSGIPSTFHINLAKVKNYKVAIIDNGMLPSKILNDSTILKIKGVEDRIVSADTVQMKIDNNKFLEISPDGKLLVNTQKGSQIIVITFANKTSILKSLNGKIATAREELGGIIVFEKDNHEIYEQFIVQNIGANNYIITTPFKEDLVIPEDHIHFYTKRYTNKPLSVEFIK